MGILDALNNPSALAGLSVLANPRRPAQGLLSGIGLNQANQAQQIQNQLAQAQTIKALQREPEKPDLWSLALKAAGGDPERALEIAERIKSRSAIQQNVNVGGEPDPFFKGLQGELAKSFVNKKTAAEDAVKSIASSTQALNLLNEGMITGRGANVLVFMGGALKQLGYDLNSDPIANAQAFGSLMASQTAQIIKQFGAGTGLSDADREYALKAAGGDIEMEEDAIRRILRINAEANRNLVVGYNEEADKIMSRPNASKFIPIDLNISVPDLPSFDNPTISSSPASIPIDDLIEKYKAKK